MELTPEQEALNEEQRIQYDLTIDHFGSYCQEYLVHPRVIIEAFCTMARSESPAPTNIHEGWCAGLQTMMDEDVIYALASAEWGTFNNEMQVAG